MTDSQHIILYYNTRIKNKICQITLIQLIRNGLIFYKYVNVSLSIIIKCKHPINR